MSRACCVEMVGHKPIRSTKARPRAARHPWLRARSPSVRLPATQRQMVLTTNYLISSVSVPGSPALGSIWEDPEGGGSCLGVTPSISSRPPGWMMILRKVICTSRPSDSDAASVLGRILASKPAYAELFSTASLVKYAVNPPSPPAASPAARIASFNATVTRLSDPGGRPGPGLP